MHCMSKVLQLENGNCEECRHKDGSKNGGGACMYRDEMREGQGEKC